MDGFQVVHSEMFTRSPRITEATCLIGPTRINFNKCALLQLNSCDFIRIEVNPIRKCFLVIPVTSSDKDSIRWTKGASAKVIRFLESKAFGSELYKSWKLGLQLNYRATGKLVSVKSKVMLFFDFNESETWKNSKEVKNECSSIDP